MFSVSLQHDDCTVLLWVSCCSCVTGNFSVWKPVFICLILNHFRASLWALLIVDMCCGPVKKGNLTVWLKHLHASVKFTSEYNVSCIQALIQDQALTRKCFPASVHLDSCLRVLILGDLSWFYLLPLVLLPDLFSTVAVQRGGVLQAQHSRELDFNLAQKVEN